MFLEINARRGSAGFANIGGLEGPGGEFSQASRGVEGFCRVKKTRVAQRLMPWREELDGDGWVAPVGEWEFVAG